MPFDPGEIGKISEKGLKWGYWWVTHKVLLRKLLTIAIGIVAGVLVAYAGYGFLDWFFGSGVRERAEIGLLTKAVTPFSDFRAASTPQQLSLSTATVLDSGSGRYDIFSRAVNPNEQWWVEFDYTVETGVSAPIQKTAYLLPGETKNLHALGIKADSRPGNPSFMIDNISWHRVDQHVVRPDYRSWAGARLNFRLSDLKFVPPDPADPLPVSNAEFTVVNDTAFSYYEVGFFVTLYSGNRVAGVNYVTISELRAGERRPVKAAWFNSLPTVSRVEVTPEVNIFDDLVYIPPGR